MQGKIRIAAVIAMFLVAPAGAQQALHCDGLDPTAPGDATRAFECVSKLSADLEQALVRIQALEADAHKVPEKQLVPKGAVVAFDDSDGCPSDWSPFSPANSRLIVGAHHGGDNAGGVVTLFSVDPSGETLTPYKYREHGGWQMVTLTEAQMPNHSHTFNFWYSDSDGSDATFDKNQSPRIRTGLNTRNRWTEPHVEGVIDKIGGSRPHPNMPPYIALYFCKKD